MFHVVRQPTVEISEPTGEAMSQEMSQAFEDADVGAWNELIATIAAPWKSSFTEQACADGHVLPPAALQDALSEAWQRSIAASVEVGTCLSVPAYLLRKAELIEQLSNEYACVVYQNIPGGVGAKIAERQRILTLLLAGRLRGLGAG